MTNIKEQSFPIEKTNFSKLTNNISYKKAEKMYQYGKKLDELIDEGKSYEEIRDFINPKRAKKRKKLLEKESLTADEIMWLKNDKIDNESPSTKKIEIRNEERIAEIFKIVLSVLKDTKKAEKYMKHHKNNEKIFAEVIKNGIY